MEEADTPEQLIGVVAHEIGHIAGGHLVRLQSELKKARTSMLAAQALGVIVGAASGRVDAGLAAASLGTHTLPDVPFGRFHVLKNPLLMPLPSKLSMRQGIPLRAF